MSEITCPKLSRYLREFCTSKPATMPIVVGRLAAQTPSRFRVRSSIPDATTSGGTQAKQAVSPGMMTCRSEHPCALVELAVSQRTESLHEKPLVGGCCTWM